jgi:hypothetical protein
MHGRLMRAWIMVQLTTKVKPAADIRVDELARMYSVYQSNYDATSFEDFKLDLSEKSFVIQLVTAQELIVGFTTLSWYPVKHPETGESLRIVYSGDTIIEPAYWGTQALPAAWCQLAGELKARVPEDRLLWFLIVKGYRTYRYLPLFTRSYFPAFDQNTGDYKSIADMLALQKFGTLYNSATGVVHFPVSKGHLNPTLAGVKEHLRSKPEVAFFFARNPGYTRGDELVCLTELNIQNMKSVALRAFMEGYFHANKQDNPGMAEASPPVQVFA